MECTIETDDEGHIFVPLTDETKHTMYLVCDDPTLLRHGTKVKLVHVTEEELAQLPIPVKRNVVVQPDSPPPSVVTFEDLHLQQELLDGVYDMGFDTPWELQEKALPTLLADPPQNMIAQSQSGTGKTVSHILAMLSRTDTSKNYPHVVCLVPSAELAIETGEVAKKIAQHMLNIKIKTVVGGEKRNRGLKLTEQILIGTPGKLLDWGTKFSFFDLSKVEVFVLDDATRMSAFQDLQDQSIAIQKLLPSTCQMILLSTTDDEDVMNFAGTIISNNPVLLKLPYIPKELGTLKQRFIVCETNRDKYHFIVTLRGVLDFGRAVIFCRSHKTADWLAKKLHKQGLAVALLSGQLEFEQRVNIVDQFRTGEKKVLVSTHFLARGMDLQHATNLVINFDLPTFKEGKADCDTYHDCIGREALFGPSRVAINFVEGDDPQSMSVLKQIEQHFEVTMTQLDAGYVDEIGWEDLLGSV